MNEMKSKTIGCAILTYKAKHHLKKCLPPLLNSPLKPKVLVVDSSSNDGTAELAASLGAETLIIPQTQFNHGKTRELARNALDTDIVCMFTQDAYLVNEKSLALLVAPIIEDKAKISYARQIPHPGASFFEAFPRHYNYSSTSQLRGLNDSHQYGAYTFFCSNSCAAYDNEALNLIGGFTEVLLGEDTLATAKILRHGHKIAYCADALVYHSHDYTLKEEFLRSFDTGLARKGFADLIACGGSDEKRGVGYVKEMILQLSKTAPWLLPYACAHVLAKWSGYKIGSYSTNAPKWFKRLLSSQKYYWK
jgi:rhamnosyltransferase